MTCRQLRHWDLYLHAFPVSDSSSKMNSAKVSVTMFPGLIIFGNMANQAMWSSRTKIHFWLELRLGL